MDRTFWQQLVRGILVALVIAAILEAVHFVIPLIYPFVFGWLIVYLLGPAIRLLQRRGRLPRWLAVLVTLLLFMGGVGAIVYLAASRLLIELNVLSDVINNRLQTLTNRGVQFIQSDLLKQLLNQVDTFLKQNSSYQGSVTKGLDSIGNQISNAFSNIVQFAVNLIVGFLTALPSIAIVTVVTILGAFLIGKDWDRLRRRFSAWMPVSLKIPAKGIWLDLEKALFGYIRAQLILVSITTLLIIVGLLVLRVPYALSVGLLIGICDLLPYLGTGFILIPWLLYCFAMGNVRMGLGLAIVYGVVIVARQSVEPKVLASNIGLNSLATLISMYVGLQLFGVVGLFYGPAFLVVVNAFQRAGVFRDIRFFVIHGRSWRERARQTTGSSDTPPAPRDPI